jgi:predicted esterase
MKPANLGLFSVLPALLVAACSASSPEGDDGVGGSGGSVSSGSAGAAAGGAGTAGSLVGGAGSSSAGAVSAGTTSTGGSGGASVGGAGAGNGGGSGGANAGSAGMGGTAGAGNRPVKPSAGCAKASAQVTLPSSLTGIPPNYDGSQPVPVVIAFHAAGNDNTSQQNTFKNSDLAKKYLMVYPNSTSATTANKTGWNMQADKSRYVELKSALLSQACVDENRIYATGHSSGAQFVVALLCSGDADFDGVAPVASSVACQKWQNGAVPSLIIHGVQDEERTKYNLNDGDGKKDLQPYLTSNSCEMASTPFSPDVSKCSNVSGVDGKPFNHGCVDFNGCDVKTRWCNHNDPSYGTTNHGIPCFGVRAIYDFFESL